jgi:LacI family repressor for deo operon, udp, cdd, tsx, nupC, and nupG
MDARPQRFCASDRWLGFIAELSRHGIKVPDDVSVMGFDDIDFAEQFISLTTIPAGSKVDW